MVAGPRAVSHHCRMGRTPGAVALLVTTVAVGTSAAGDHPGRVVRVEAPPRIEVFVPAGRFMMGVDPDTASAATAQCDLMYSPMLTGYTGASPPGPRELLRGLLRHARRDAAAGGLPRRVRDRSARGHRGRLPALRRGGRVQARSARRRRRALHPRRLADGQRHLGRVAGLLPLARRAAAHRGRVGARGARHRAAGDLAVGRARAAEGLQPRPAARLRDAPDSSASRRRRR